MSVLESLATRIEGAGALDGWARFARGKAHHAFVDNERLDSFFEGEWLGHRVHPIAVQAPLGAFTMATLLSLTGVERHGQAIDTLVLTGVVTAIPAAISGGHDLATTSGGTTRVAVVHAAANNLALGLFATAWVKGRRGERRKARRLMLAGSAIAGVGAYLGGHMVYRLGVGVEH